MTDASAADRAAALHRDAIVVDGHTDILMPIADGKMRLGDRFDLPDPGTWQPPAGWQADAEAALYNFSPHTSFFQTMGHYDLPRFREGGLTVQAMAIFIEAANLDRALHRALRMVYWLNREYEENADFAPVTSVAAIRQLKRDGKMGGILAFEGFEPIGSDLKLLDVFYALGLRIATLTHSRRNYWADGTQSGVATTGLTEPGRQAVRRMNELGIVIDLAHLAPKGCWEVLEQSEAPVILSHSSPRRAFGGESGDDTRRMMEALAKKGGVIGIIAWDQSDLAAYLDDVETVIREFGPDCVGLGTDFFGIERAPTGFVGMHELPNVTRGLVERGHSDDVIRQVLGENYLRVFEQVWR
ncbi:MAG TPA: membrane dipeptidase [Thermomicrobiales bacterium]|nr:membrane dipeptidase [Thermomicrobiales bacterium]